MQKIFNKIIAISITFIMVSANFIATSVYAANEINNNISTSNENVQFDANIDGQYNTKADIEKGATLNIFLNVVTTGYLKEAKVSFEGNNYSIQNVINDNIKEISNNAIEFNQINVGETKNIAIPIKLEKTDLLDSDAFSKDSIVKLNAIYVNAKGKEVQVSKTITEHLDWIGFANYKIAQNLTRYIKYENGKTMLSFSISDGIEQNKIPILNKEIKIVAPKIGDASANKVIVTGDIDSYTYDKDGTVTIKKENKKDDNGKINWSSNSSCIVTYLYDTSIETTKVEAKVEAKASLITGETLNATSENSQYTLKSQVGQIVEADVIGTENLSKGYLYTNLNRENDKLETPFSLTYKINVAYADLTDKIKIVEGKTYLDSEKDLSKYIKVKKVSISAQELEKILGEDGTINVIADDGTKLGTLSKNTTEITINSASINLETSKTISEGNLNINVQKVITTDVPYTKEQIETFKKITSNIEAQAFKGEKTVSDKATAFEIKLTEPTSNATLAINTNNLSTVVENKDVVITATLNTNSIDDALYKNPTLNITLPSEIKKINLTDARLLYENELVPTSFTTDGNNINLVLSGTQTQYSSQAISDGTVVRMVADLTLDNLAPSKTEMLSMSYANEATSESKIVTANVNIVAQTGFVTTNELTVDGTTTISQENQENLAKVKTNVEQKEMTVGGTIVNNIGTDAEGVIVIGRIPYHSNKTEEGTDIGSNIDTTMASALTILGTEATIYYSDNIDEKIDGTTWTTMYKATSKSFKIVPNAKIPNGTTIKFSYKDTLPANLNYENTAKAIYAIYYNNNSQEGAKQNLLISKAVGITTGAIPAVTTEISAEDSSMGTKIENNGNVTEGEYITYKAVVTNTGKEDATNVKITATLPEGISIVQYTDISAGAGTYSIDTTTKQIVREIPIVKAGSNETAEFNLAVTQVIADAKFGITDAQLEEKEKLTVKFVTTADKIENVENNFTVKNTLGYLHVDLSSDLSISTQKVEKDQTVKYKVSVKNVNSTSKNNIVVNLHLPTGIEYIGEKYASSYDKNTNTVTAKIDTINPYSRYSLLFDTKVVADNSDNLTAYATAQCDENATETKSNTLTFSSKDVTANVIATQTSNISENSILDTDDLEFYVDITNNSIEDLSFTFKDNLPNGLYIKYYKLVADGKIIQEAKAGYISTIFNLAKGKSARATIAVDINSIEKGKTLEIENAPTLTTYSGANISLNTMKYTITGTGNITENTTTDDNTVNSKDGTYKISGVAWFDENFDGKKDLNESRISGLTSKLFNKDTGNIATDVDGKELSTVTDTYGKYLFNNVKPGNYYVVVDYDSTQYDITTYKVKDYAESENSDFVLNKNADKQIAVTDTITINNSNIYNIDLGLTNKKKFDLKLEQKISKITVTNTKSKTHSYDFNKNIAKVELSSKYIEYSTVLVEYKITITNEGQIAGYAKNIVDYIPSGMTFNSELNANWYVGEDGNGYNTSLANTIINPGETKEITLVLSKKMTADNTGTTRNIAEIKTEYNEYGLNDSDSTPGNKKDGEDDISSTDAVILVGTGKEAASITGIAIGILAIIALAVYEVKKHVINKMYRNII